MPVVAVYATEQEFIEHLHGYLGDEITTALGLVATPAPSATYQEAMNDTLRLLNIQTVDQVTGAVLEVAGHIAIWRRVQRAYILRFNFSADGGSYSVGDVWDHINKMLADSELEGVGIGIINKAQPSRVLKTKIVW